MFELPVSNDITINAFNLKKLRYQYMNDIHSKYAKLNRNEPLTPVSSENETNVGDQDRGDDSDTIAEDIDVVRERRIRRWKSIMGEAISDEEDDIQEDSSLYECQEDILPTDEEKKYFLRYDKPQESFEKWETDLVKRQVPIDKKFVTYQKVKSLRGRINKKYEFKTMHVNKNVKNNLELIIDGFEIANENNINLNKKFQNYSKSHLSILTNLMYSNIFKKKWALAYRCFIILIRIPDVDIRRIWNLGAIILQNISTSKLIDFLQWLNSVFSNKNRSFIQGINYRNDQTNFNGGSRRLTPLYTKTLLWNKLFLLSEKPDTSLELDQLIEQISEMVVIPPYSEDNEIWYIFGLCYLIKADYLSGKLSLANQRTFQEDDIDSYPNDTEISNNQITQCINNCRKHLKRSLQDKTFTYPIRAIDLKLKSIETRTFTNNL